MWKVIDSHICSQTGIKFACIHNAESIKILIWYTGVLILNPGDIVMPIAIHKGLIVNGEFSEVEILHIAKFKAELWLKICCTPNSILYSSVF